MIITDETMDYIASLAKLTLSESEKAKAKEELSKIIEYFEIINELDTEDVVPMPHTFLMGNVFREDEAVNLPDRENILKNAPALKDGSFMVPKTVE